MLVLTLFIAGCGSKKAPDTEVPAPKMGIIDMTKAVKAHPQYNQLMDLGQQVDTIAAQLEAQQIGKARVAPVEGISEVSNQQMEALNTASKQEFNAKMSAKQEELSPRITAKVDSSRQVLSDEMKTYNDQLDKEYQPQIFNLQLKLKTVQLSKEEAGTLQADLEKLQAKRSEALGAKQKQLTARMDELVAPEKAAVEGQLATYAKSLNEQISQQAATKQAEIVARANKQNPAVVQTEQPTNDMAQQGTMKKQEFDALQASIIANIIEKAAKVATENGYEAVLTNIAVNVSAVDITTQVIDECNK